MLKMFQFKKYKYFTIVQGGVISENQSLELTKLSEI